MLVNSNLDDRAQNAVIGETHGFGPSIVNQLRVGLNREHALWLRPNGDVAGIPQQFRILGVLQASQNGGLPPIGFPYNWKTPYTESHNFMLQFQLTGSSTITLGYVGLNSRHVETVLSPNPVLELLSPGTNSINYIPYPKIATAGNNYTSTQASNRYNSLQATFEKRFSAGLSSLANFTWQKALADARDPLETR